MLECHVRVENQIEKNQILFDNTLKKYQKYQNAYKILLSWNFWQMCKHLEYFSKYIDFRSFLPLRWEVRITQQTRVPLSRIN